jgi:hypothetical protein
MCSTMGLIVPSRCFVPKARRLHGWPICKRCASCDRSLAARGMAEFARDSHQSGNGFGLGLRNSSIQCRGQPAALMHHLH